MTKCKECGNQVSKKASQCPHCGAPVKKKTGCGKLLLLGFFGFIAMGAIGSLMRDRSNSSESKEPTASIAEKPTQTSEPETNPPQEPERQPTAPPFDLHTVGSNELPSTTTLKESHRFMIAAGSGTADAPAGTQVKVLGIEGDQLKVAFLDGSDSLPYTKTTIDSDVLKYREEVRKREAERVAAEEQERVALEQAHKAQTDQKTARKSQIKVQFSLWNGSHNRLTEYIKKSMNDPKSYEHDETHYIDRGDHLIVTTAFRGKNAFGAIVRNTVTARVDLDGNVLEIISQK